MAGTVLLRFKFNTEKKKLISRFTKKIATLNNELHDNKK